MKKILLLLSLGMLAASASAQAPADPYVVFGENGINPELHYYYWWNAATNDNDTDPVNPTAKALSLKANDGGAAASCGWNMEAPQNTGYLHNATLNFSWYANTKSKYTIRLTSVDEENYTFTPTDDQLNKWNTVSLNVPTTFEKVAEQWNLNKKEGVGYVFSIVMENGQEGAVIYFKDINYTGIDKNWVPIVQEDPAPQNVLAQTKDKANVLSVIGYYGNVDYGNGGWGETTSITPKEIEGQTVLKLKNFNYFGLYGFNLNAADYDYMHVEYWTPSDDAVFGFVPISLNPTVDTPIYEVPSVKANEWNAYDVPMKNFSADASKIEQLKFVANLQGKTNTELGYITNIYFWKEEGKTDPDPGEQPGDDGEGKYVLSGPIFADVTQNSVDMEMEDGIATYTGSFQKQVFNVKKVNGSEEVVYGPTGAGDITYFGEYPGMVTSSQWVFSGVVIPHATGILTVSFDPQTLKFYVLPVVEDSHIEGTVADGDDTVEITEGFINVTTKNASATISFNVPNGVELWYNDTPNADVMATALADEGYAKAENGQVTLNAGTGNLELVYVHADSGKKSAVATYGYSVGSSTGVDALGVESAKAEYYNLQGVKVQNPDKGIYLKVEGKKVTKVVL